MVEPDRDIAAFIGEDAVDRVQLRVALGRPRQLLLGDQRLMLLHPGHVGVAEHRDPVGLEVERAPRGAGDALLGLHGRP